MFNRGMGMGQMPPVLKNLIIINVLFFVAKYVAGNMGIDLDRLFGLHYPQSEYFRPFQYVTHIFMHGDIMHIMMNMFMLWMFGRVMENVWGGKRFFTYFIITGLGAAVLHTFVIYLEMNSVYHAINQYMTDPTPKHMAQLVHDKFPELTQYAQKNLLSVWYNDPTNNYYIEQSRLMIDQMLRFKINIPTVGASGAVYGVLLAFGMTFPNLEVMLIFLPMFPIKAKYMVIGMGVMELLYGVSMPGSNIAHFAHLGGMVFGFILIKFWKKTTRMY